MNVTCSIQARMGSTRLPGKVMLHLGGRRVIERVVGRAETADRIDDVRLTLGDRPENEVLTELCDRNGYRCHTGPEDDLLVRHLGVAEASGCDALARITGDAPFVPPWEIDRVVEEHRDNDAPYTTNHGSGIPTGTEVDVLDVEILRRLRDLGEDHPVLALRSEPERWGTVCSSDDRLEAYSDCHVAVDTPRDYWRLVDAVDAVGPAPIDVMDWISSHA